MSPVPVHSVSEATRRRHLVPAFSVSSFSATRGESCEEECLELERTLSFLARVISSSLQVHTPPSISHLGPSFEKSKLVALNVWSSLFRNATRAEECLELERTLSVPVTCARFSDLPATACINPPASLHVAARHCSSLPGARAISLPAALLPSPSYTLLYRPMQSLHSPPAFIPIHPSPPLPLPSIPSTHAFRGRSYGSTGVIISADPAWGCAGRRGDAQYLDEFGCRCTYQCGARALSLAGGDGFLPILRVALLFAQCVSGSSMMARDARVNGDEREKGRKAAIVLDRPSSRAPYCTHFARGARRAPQT
ncbi:hypothetical protein B0H13DRAFT_2404178 [Mycena leptocephala]|nr:hypothetical protein B0H13DRAFT_2404178 [Mycena leptocephala]